ncbi:MAG: hypothetical protein A2001_01425 [Treponema sp. GWC1_61_84]|nr:MAG: hypothetical protein A2001_01425 [Treponema sp. GWC1_61_84]
MENTKQDWRVAARRTILGEKYQLATLPGIYVVPRKYSIRGEDAIQSLAMRKQSKMRREIVQSIIKKAREEEEKTAAAGGEPADRDKEALALQDKVSAELLGELDPEVLASRDFMALRLKYGVGEHNFDGEPTEVVTDAWVDAVLEYPDTAAEILKAVEDWNSPLAKGTPGGSGTSPNGGTTEPASTPT